MMGDASAKSWSWDRDSNIRGERGPDLATPRGSPAVLLPVAALIDTQAGWLNPVKFSHGSGGTSPKSRCWQDHHTRSRGESASRLPLSTAVAGTPGMFLA